MAEEASFGVRRLRQAITNQATCGSGQFELSIDSADRLCRECEDELAQVAWAKDVPAPVDADGKVVPLTTRAMYTHSGKKVNVNAGSPLSYDPDAGEWFVFFDGAVKDRLTALHLHRPDSWERLEEEIERMVPGEGFLSECYYFNEEGLECSECPARGSGSCSRCVALDVLRRAKALAERDAKASTPQSSSHEAKEADRD